MRYDTIIACPYFQLATSAGLKPQHAALLVSVLGAANTLGRIVMGLVADLPGVSALVLTGITGFGGIVVVTIRLYNVQCSHP